MYRFVQPLSAKRFPLRMLFQPAGNGVYYRACEADSYRGLVAALLDDQEYETADAESRLVSRLRLAHDIALLGELERRRIEVSDRPGADTIDISSESPFIRSLHSLGAVSLEPSLIQEESDDSRST